MSFEAPAERNAALSPDSAEEEDLRGFFPGQGWVGPFFALGGFAMSMFVVIAVCAWQVCRNTSARRRNDTMLQLGDASFQSWSELIVFVDLDRHLAYPLPPPAPEQQSPLAASAPSPPAQNPPPIPRQPPDERPSTDTTAPQSDRMAGSPTTAAQPNPLHCPIITPFSAAPRSDEPEVSAHSAAQHSTGAQRDCDGDAVPRPASGCRQEGMHGTHAAVLWTAAVAPEATDDPLSATEWSSAREWFCALTLRAVPTVAVLPDGMLGLCTRSSSVPSDSANSGLPEACAAASSVASADAVHAARCDDASGSAQHAARCEMMQAQGRGLIRPVSGGDGCSCALRADRGCGGVCCEMPPSLECNDGSGLGFHPGLTEDGAMLRQRAGCGTDAYRTEGSRAPSATLDGAGEDEWACCAVAREDEPTPAGVQGSCQWAGGEAARAATPLREPPAEPLAPGADVAMGAQEVRGLRGAEAAGRALEAEHVIDVNSAVHEPQNAAQTQTSNHPTQQPLQRSENRGHRGSSTTDGRGAVSRAGAPSATARGAAVPGASAATATGEDAEGGADDTDLECPYYFFRKTLCVADFAHAQVPQPHAAPC